MSVLEREGDIESCLRDLIELAKASLEPEEKEFIDSKTIFYPDGELRKSKTPFQDFLYFLALSKGFLLVNDEHQRKFCETVGLDPEFFKRFQLSGSAAYAGSRFAFFDRDSRNDNADIKALARFFNIDEALMLQLFFTAFATREQQFDLISESEDVDVTPIVNEVIDRLNEILFSIEKMQVYGVLSSLLESEPLGFKTDILQKLDKMELPESGIRNTVRIILQSVLPKHLSKR